ncbi:MAG: MBL fold metallo-hydrolase [Planctomycetota bacterium]|nr:MBL fold metallo-hydrolase [Planctomycetaceae bacterium]MEC9008753.1 MBL fold metallo-hydrolase [Planctomycetota bacterium]MED5449037.1 MBL fold metallo-hydrolase [Planctomycetota bacterium]|tara:strand:+ start:1066 stop:1905 length:840 start_codon:yes stop_codon:yes gene_type:complete
MIDNLPLRSHVHRGLTIEGYSRAAVQTYWRIPELKLGFDMGGSPWSFMGTNTFFISHGHLDHMAALPVFVARRRMMKMEPPTIYVPAKIHDQVWKMLNAWRQLDRGRMICNLVPVADGDEFELSRERVVTVFDTVHTVPSVGYLVWDRRRKLKEDLVGVDEDEIRKRRLGGEDVTREVRMPLVCYCGDTAPAGLDNYDPVFQSRVLITEMTFFRPDHRKDKIHKFGHTHLDDIIERAERFENELIILAHFSTRYQDSQVRREVKKRLPESLRDRVELWV